MRHAAERDCRKTLCLKKFHKNLPQQAQKSPKCCSEHKKQGAFQCFCPTSQRSVFEKGLFRQFQRFVSLTLGWAAERRSIGKMLVEAADPHQSVHALLGNHEPARTLAIKKAQSLTDKLAP